MSPSSLRQGRAGRGGDHGTPVPGAPQVGRVKRDRAERKAARACHEIDRAIEAAEFRSYGELAKALGITQPRVSQVAGLLLLPPVVQEWVLRGDAGVGIRGLVRAAREAEWAAAAGVEQGAQPDDARK
jgi:hypothetical protein